LNLVASDLQVKLYHIARALARAGGNPLIRAVFSARACAAAGR